MIFFYSLKLSKNIVLYGHIMLKLIPGDGIMMKLNDNDWNFINDLIFKINSITDLNEMRYTFLDLIVF